MREHLKFARSLSKLLDSQFKIGKFSFGLDPILGLFPGFGDLVSLGLSGYIVWIGIQLKLPPERIVQMIGNLALDFLVGLIPVIGDIADFAIKSNIKNLKILEKYAPADILEGEIT